MELLEKDKKIKENQIAIKTATQIMNKSISHDIFNNIINITDVKKMWKKL